MDFGIADDGERTGRSVHTIAYPDRSIRLGSVGLPAPYARVRVVKLDNNGWLERHCAVDEIGVVIMSGPGVFGSYLNEVHNKSAFVDGNWVNSGDLGRLDEDGFLWITCRAKDLVIRGGHNIDPDEGVQGGVWGFQASQSTLRSNCNGQSVTLL